jgi:hypothetical protein
VAPGQVSALGASFTPFVNDLLRVESSAANLDGGQLTTTYRDNIDDKGVDAGLRRAVGTKYIPSGDSAWQFKAGDLPPAKCKKELRGAEERGGSAALEGGGRVPGGWRPARRPPQVAFTAWPITQAEGRYWCH